MRIDRIDEAKNHIEIVLRLNPEFASCYYNLGQIYMKKKEYLNAIDSFKKSLSLDANAIKAYFNIAGAYHSLKDTKNAIKYWEKAIEYDKENQDAYINLAICSINELQDSAKALRYIRSAYEINKKNANVVFHYGLILLKTNDSYRAEEKFKEALEIDNKLNQAQIAIAECKAKQNKPYEALEILNNYDETQRNKKDYLYIRVLVLNEILRNEKENQQVRDEILMICDRIQTEYGDSAMVEELRQQMKQ